MKDISSKCSMLDLSEDPYIRKTKIIYLKDIVAKNNVIVDNILWLKIYETDIEELYDINLFKNLRVLNISDNKLIIVDKIPDTVEEISCENNNLVELNFLNPGLLRLNCSGNKIKSITHNNIKTLYCSDNCIRDINCINIKNLHCENNSMVSIPSLPQLEYLNCSNNKLLKLPILPKCMEIYANDNNLVKIDNIYQRLSVIHIYNNPDLKSICFSPSISTICCDDRDGLLVSDKYRLLDVYYEGIYLGLRCGAKNI